MHCSRNSPKKVRRANTTISDFVLLPNISTTFSSTIGPSQASESDFANNILKQFADGKVIDRTTFEVIIHWIASIRCQAPMGSPELHAMVKDNGGQYLLKFTVQLRSQILHVYAGKLPCCSQLHDEAWYSYSAQWSTASMFVSDCTRYWWARDSNHWSMSLLYEAQASTQGAHAIHCFTPEHGGIIFSELYIYIYYVHISVHLCMHIYIYV